MTIHAKVTVGDIHAIHNWILSNTIERDALSVSSLDIGKVCWQQDNDTYWVLKTASPMTWNSFGGSSSVNLDGGSAITNYGGISSNIDGGSA